MKKIIISLDADFFGKFMINLVYVRYQVGTGVIEHGRRLFSFTWDTIPDLQHADQVVIPFGVKKIRNSLEQWLRTHAIVTESDVRMAAEAKQTPELFAAERASNRIVGIMPTRTPSVYRGMRIVAPLYGVPFSPRNDVLLLLEHLHGNDGFKLPSKVSALEQIR